MTKTFLTAAAMAALTLGASAVMAQAQEFKFNPYVGFDLQRYNVSYNDNYDIGGGLALNGDAILDDSLTGINLHVGNRFHENFAAELGFFRTKQESETVASGATVGPGTVATGNFSTDVRLQGITLDGLGYFPLDDNGRFELIGTAGISWTDAEVEATVPGVGVGDADDQEFGFRVGGGLEFGLTDDVSLRGLARYQTADFDDVVDNIWVFNLGLNYSF